MRLIEIEVCSIFTVRLEAYSYDVRYINVYERQLFEVHLNEHITSNIISYTLFL